MGIKHKPHRNYAVCLFVVVLFNFKAHAVFSTLHDIEATSVTPDIALQVGTCLIIKF